LSVIGTTHYDLLTSQTPSTRQCHALGHFRYLVYRRAPAVRHGHRRVRRDHRHTIRRPPGGGLRDVSVRPRADNLDDRTV